MKKISLLIAGAALIASGSAFAGPVEIKKEEPAKVEEKAAVKEEKQEDKKAKKLAKKESKEIKKEEKKEEAKASEPSVKQ